MAGEIKIWRTQSGKVRILSGEKKAQSWFPDEIAKAFTGEYLWISEDGNPIHKKHWSNVVDGSGDTFVDQTNLEAYLDTVFEETGAPIYQNDTINGGIIM